MLKVGEKITKIDKIVKNDKNVKLWGKSKTK